MFIALLPTIASATDVEHTALCGSTRGPTATGVIPGNHGVARRGPPHAARAQLVVASGAAGQVGVWEVARPGGVRVSVGGLGDGGGQGRPSVGFLLGGVDDHGPRSG